MTLTGKGLAEFSASVIGTPYVYGAKGADGPFTQNKLNILSSLYPSVFTQTYIKKIYDKKIIGQVATDCSGLISWYTGKVLGSAQLYQKAYARLPMNKLSDFAIGTVLYKSGHVGVYAGTNSKGEPVCIEAKGIDYGTISGVITNPNRWKCGLTFDWIDYNIEKPISDISYHTGNPYVRDQKILISKRGHKGETVRWIQYELIEAGFGYSFVYNGKPYSAITIDGSFGPKTEAAVKLFQRSCKIKEDGIVGPMTFSMLDNDKGDHVIISRNPYLVPTRTLSKGKKGQDIMWLQWELVHIHHAIIPNSNEIDIDGSFGDITKKAVMHYQQANNLQVDGVVGKNTLKSLLGG